MEEQDIDGEKPPLFRRWSSWYLLLLGTLLVQVLIYYFITASFS